MYYLAGYPVSGQAGYPVSGKIIGRISGQISIRYNPKKKVGFPLSLLNYDMKGVTNIKILKYSVLISCS